MENRIRVGITGQAGFVGSHLYNFLGTKPREVDRIIFKKEYFEQPKKLQNFVKYCDVIVHLAAMNRHSNPQVIYDTNILLVERLIEACETSGANPKIIFSSSTQEEQDNLYGKSKKYGRFLFEAWAERNVATIKSLIVPNVFGPFGKPFYNSFIATFCHQLIQGEQPAILKDNEVNLIYVNELSQKIFNEIISKESKSSSVYKIPHTSTKRVSEILALLQIFKSEYYDNGHVPAVPLGSFELNLFNTFTSFIPKTHFPRKFVKHTDNRGAFVEIMRTETAGQSSYSTTVPGITRGNHYHTRKIERFAVISGKASIKLRKIDSDEIYEYILNGLEPAYVDMPIWYTHNITNIGESELITLFWINEAYNPEDADTYFVKV